MIRSMTGYGSSENSNEHAQIYVEIKSLNSRFFDFYSKSSKILSIYDDEIKNKIKNSCVRGNIQLKTKIEFFSINKIDINFEKVQAYLEIRDRLFEFDKSNNLGKLSIDKLMSMSDIYETEKKDPSIVKDLYFQCIDQAISDLNDSRALEGKNIKKGFDENLKNLDIGLGKILQLDKRNIKEEFNVYKNKITKILDDTDIDENRLYQEIAIIIDKKDINEEIVRLSSHLDILRGYLKEKNEIGKKINFMLQEIGREINTISSKASNIEITHEVLNMKNQVEQIREQVQNIL